MARRDSSISLFGDFVETERYFSAINELHVTLYDSYRSAWSLELEDRSVEEATSHGRHSPQNDVGIRHGVVLGGHLASQSLQTLLRFKHALS